MQTCLIALYKILTVGNSLVLEILRFLGLLLALIFLILDILRYLGYIKVYVGIWIYMVHTSIWCFPSPGWRNVA